MAQYEYSTVRIFDPFSKVATVSEQASKDLNNLGAQGWQVVRLEPSSGFCQAVLVREKPAETN